MQKKCHLKVIVGGKCMFLNNFRLLLLTLVLWQLNITMLWPELSLFCCRSLDRYAASEACQIVYDPQSLYYLYLQGVLKSIQILKIMYCIPDKAGPANWQHASHVVALPPSQLSLGGEQVQEDWKVSTFPLQQGRKSQGFLVECEKKD